MDSPRILNLRHLDCAAALAVELVEGPGLERSVAWVKDQVFLNPVGLAGFL
jgi:hypothetical protein